MEDAGDSAGRSLTTSRTRGSGHFQVSPIYNSWKVYIQVCEMAKLLGLLSGDFSYFSFIIFAKPFL